MVKVRDDLPATSDGRVDLVKWLELRAPNYSKEQQALLLQAGELAVHYGQMTTPVQLTAFSQGLLTAEVLFQLQPDVQTLCAAVVYAAAQYGHLPPEKIEQLLGKEILKLVEGLKKLETTTRSSSKGTEFGSIRGDNLRRMLLAIVEDVRVVLIKLAERICLLRASKDLSDEIKRKLAQETKDIFAPLANRLGIGQIKWELEDFAFRYLEPEHYKQIATLLSEKRTDREKSIKNIVSSLNQALADLKIEAQVVGRAKHIYSIWRKMQAKHVDFSEIYDVRAVRILVPTIADCYAALGVVHSLWQHIPKEFDDYIATPKDNGYRSLHTAVIGDGGRTLEVQIRTFAMHQEAELGVAAHWLYKEGKKHDSSYDTKLASLRQILNWQEHADSPETENDLIVEAFDERIYVFTPKGDVVDLPIGSTPLDFAYQVHTEIGHRCRGAKINGTIVPLSYQLKTGEQVDIISGKLAVPSRDWLNPHLGYLNSSRAKAKVQSYFKKQDREKNIQDGRDIVEKESRRLGLGKLDLQKLAEQLHLKEADDLLCNLGSGDLRWGQIISALHPATTDKQDESIPLTKKHKVNRVSTSEVTIQGIGQLVCQFAKCCHPVPGDAIVGYITQGRGITIHRQNCMQAIMNAGKDNFRLITVEWGDTQNQLYNVDVIIYAYDRKDLLKDITSILSAADVYVSAVQSGVRSADRINNIHLTLQIPSLDILDTVLNKLMQLPNVIDAHRQK